MTKRIGFVQWLLDHFIQDVPEDQALCEFDCRKQQCLRGEWQQCERRLNQAQGELMPLTQTPDEPAA
jgi:hypothetical protein